MEETQAAHAVLMQTVQGLTDRDASEASLLPGWTRGHVLTHVARNADSHVRVLTAAMRGEKVEQYVGGKEGRAADIEAGAGRPADELVTDVDTSAQRLFETWPEIPDRVWDEEILAIHGGQPAWATVFSRWRETEIHHVDLDLGYRSDNWAEPFVRATFPVLAETLERRLPPESAVELICTDVDLVHRARHGEPTRIEGPAAAVLPWLMGRPFDAKRLSTVNGDLPELSAWI